VKTDIPAPHAEVAEIWPRDGAVRVVGDFHGAGDASERWFLVVVLRDTESRRTYELPVDGGRFDVSVPVAEFVPADAASRSESAKFDLYAAPEERLEADLDSLLRFGRHLDDIIGKKKIMVFPVQQAESAGMRMAVQPFYTIKDNLSVESTPSPSASSGKESP